MSPIAPDKWLLEEDDGLPVRESHEYARNKLKLLRFYLEQFNVSMKDKWKKRHYIDLQAGPGKNRIGADFLLGSPLISLTTSVTCTDFIFNELDGDYLAALQQRAQASVLFPRITFFQDDANVIVDEVCRMIDAYDRSAKQRSEWTSLNLAFLDPEGLELKWATVEKLARVARMDLIINFSTGGIRRSIGAGNTAIVDEFFGSADWKDRWDESLKTEQMTSLIALYLSRLESFGYQLNQLEIGSEIVSFRNSRNVEVYKLIFASKHRLGKKFWGQAQELIQPQKRLL
jgi:three-Cys-motif partner protein